MKNKHGDTETRSFGREERENFNFSLYSPCLCGFIVFGLVLLSGSVVKAELKDGLILYFTFDSVSGDTVKDQSGKHETETSLRFAYPHSSVPSRYG